MAMRMTTNVAPARRATRLADARRGLLIGTIGFLTLVDLFAAQALLPQLVTRYAVSREAMGVAVNVGTIGMAVASLVVALLGARVDRRLGVVVSLGGLAIPTALLAVAPDLVTFAALRVVQGLFMATAFSLTLAYLTERCSATAAASALAAYVTGNVASNLLGRLAAATLASGINLEVTFYAFAGLNLIGAILAYRGLMRTAPMAGTMVPAVEFAVLLRPRLLGIYAVGFLILFAFIGTFTYVNYVLVEAPIAIPPMALGLVYLVFIPAMVTTPVAGRVVAALGARHAAAVGLIAALVGMALLLFPQLQSMLLGLALVGAGSFFAQAVAAGSVGRLAGASRGAAGGLYLASYYLGGLVGSIVVGMLFARLGWPSAVIGVGVALAAAIGLARLLPGRQVSG